jgi:glycosyltransferase involved in cell wall biosynthesis
MYRLLRVDQGTWTKVYSLTTSTDPTRVDYWAHSPQNLRMERMISIVVPVYFNEASLPALFKELIELEKQLLGKNLKLELIFVDDGSADNSLARLLEFKNQRPETKVVKLTRNFGATRCSKTGFKFVTGDAFLTMSADLQDPPKLVLDMADHWLKGSKFVICERITRQDPLTSKIFSKIFYILLRTFVMKDYPEGGYDMALMDKAFLPFLKDSSKSVFTPLLAYWLGFKPVVLTYHRPARQGGKSRWSFAKKVAAFWDIMLGFSMKPLRMLSAFGGLVSLASFLYGARIIYGALFDVVPVQGFPTIAALISFLLGIVILMLGVIGEYLWRIFDENNRRPDTVIDEVY